MQDYYSKYSRWLETLSGIQYIILSSQQLSKVTKVIVAEGFQPTSEQEVLATSQKAAPVHNEEYVGTYPQARLELEKMPLL